MSSQLFFLEIMFFFQFPVESGNWIELLFEKENNRTLYMYKYCMLDVSFKSCNRFNWRLGKILEKAILCTRTLISLDITDISNINYMLKYIHEKRLYYYRNKSRYMQAIRTILGENFFLKLLLPYSM